MIVNIPSNVSNEFLASSYYCFIHSSFAYNFQGSEVIEGIIVNTRFHENEVYLSASAKAFLQMSNLRLLKISNVQLPEGLEYLSSKLRLLDWHRYPLKSLPSNLQLVKAFEFNMCYSCIEELWKGIKVRTIFIYLRHLSRHIY